MDDSIIVALIACVATVITSLVGAYSVATKSTREQVTRIEKEFAAMSVKVSTLWTIYAEDAIREARASGMIGSRSKEVPTDKWAAVVPDDLDQRIRLSIIEISQILNSPYDVTVEVWAEYSDELLEVAISEDISPRALFGTLFSLSVNGVDDA